MNYRCFALVGLGWVAVHPIAAQTACDSQIVPIKPFSVVCANAAPVCITGRNEIVGHWVWACPSQSQSTPDSGAWKIPLMIQQPHIMTPAEAAAEAEKLR